MSRRAGSSSATKNIALLGPLGEDLRSSMAIYEHELASQLADLGCEVTRAEPIHPGSSDVAGVTARIRAYAARYISYQRAVAGISADVYHILDHGYLHLALSTPPARTAVTFHDALLLRLHARELPLHGYPRPAYVAHALGLRALRRIGLVIAVSASSRNDLLRFTDYPPERVRVVAQGVTPEFFPAEPRGGATLLHVGSTTPVKNVENLIRAFAIVRDELGDRALLLKAGSPFTANQRRLIQSLDLNDRIRHVGHVPRSELPSVYRAADVLVCPSLYEGFGLPVLEGMASGLPVVMSAGGSLPEVAGDAGLIIDPLNPRAIAEAALRLVTDPVLYQEQRRAGLERASSFSWEKSGRETLAAYADVLGSSG